MSSPDSHAVLPAVVVGAGPAGLAASRELTARKIEHRVLERGEGPGHCWTGLYDSLRLHTGKHLSHLPGMPFSRSAPLFVSREDFVDYLAAYADRFRLPVTNRAGVLAALPEDGVWSLETEQGRLRTRSLVMATGILSNPFVPEIPEQDRFRGRILHSVEYLRPDPHVGRRVLVVGAGNSAGEIAPELARAGADVTVAMRSGADVVPRALLGVPVQYLAWAVLKLPASARPAIVGAFRRITRALRGSPPFPGSSRGPLESVPLIGFDLVEGIRSGAIELRGGLGDFTEDGVVFHDGMEEEFDDVILATGYRPALSPIEGLVRTDSDGFAVREDRVTSADRDALYFVGHNYDATGGLANIRRDAPIVAERIAEDL